MFKKRWIFISILILSLLLTLPVSAQTKQVVVNGGFEVDTSGWTEGAYGTLSRTTSEFYDGVASGQLDLEDTSEGSYDGEIYQCIDLSGELPTWPEVGGVKYVTVSGWFKNDTGSSAITEIVVRFRSNTDCSGYISNNYSGGVSSTTWTQDTMTLAIPATTQSMRFDVSATATSPDAGPVYIDGLEAFSSTPTAVSVQHMEANSPNLITETLVTVLIVAGVVLVIQQKRSRTQPKA